MRLRISALLVGAFALTLTLTGGQRAALADTAGKSRTAAVVHYLVHVKTMNISGAGTDANVWLKVFGTKGQTGYLPLETFGDDFERGSVDTFAITANDLGAITRLCLRVDDAGLFPDWSVEWVDVGVAAGNQISGPRYAAVFNGRMPVNYGICRNASVS
jgi:hypothetical protein